MAANPTVVLTGASKGLGLAIAKILLETFNANVVALSRTKGPGLKSLADAHQGSLLALECDVTDSSSLSTAVSRGLEKYKHIDSLILNAGVIEPLGNIASDDITIEQWKQHFDTNFFSLVVALRAALPELRKSSFGGRVIFMSSGSAVGNTPAWGPYNASKAAMNSLCRTIALEEQDMTFIALRPGMVDTDMQTLIRERGAATMPPQSLKTFTDAYEKKKLHPPEEPGHVAAALALKAPKSLSGRFISWDDEEFKKFRRE